MQQGRKPMDAVSYMHDWAQTIAAQRHDFVRTLRRAIKDGEIAPHVAAQLMELIGKNIKL
jgi:hypothetical protein